MTWTLTDAIAQREAILANLGIQRSQYQGRSIEYPAGDARIKELNYLDDLIKQMTAQQTTGGTSGTRCTYGKFNRG